MTASEIQIRQRSHHADHAAIFGQSTQPCLLESELLLDDADSFDSERRWAPGERSPQGADLLLQALQVFYAQVPDTALEQLEAAATQPGG